MAGSNGVIIINKYDRDTGRKQNSITKIILATQQEKKQTDRMWFLKIMRNSLNKQQANAYCLQETKDLYKSIWTELNIRISELKKANV